MRRLTHLFSWALVLSIGLEPCVQAVQKISNSSKKKVMVVTGATSGIGHKMVTVLAEKHRENAVIYIMGRRGELLDQLASEIKDATVIPVVGDVANSKDMKNLASKIEQEHGYITTLFANAGGPGPIGFTAEVDFAECEECIDGHVNQQYLIRRHMNGLVKKVTTSTFVKETEDPKDKSLKAPPYLFTLVYPMAQSMKEWIRKALVLENPETTNMAIYGGATKTKFIRQVYGGIAAKLTEIDGIEGIPDPKTLRKTTQKVRGLIGNESISPSDHQSIGKEFGVPPEAVSRAFHQVKAHAEAMAEGRRKSLEADFKEPVEVARIAVDLSENGKSGETRPWDKSDNITAKLPVYASMGPPPQPKTPTRLDGKYVLITYNRLAVVRAREIADVLYDAGAKTILMAVNGASPIETPAGIYGVVHVTGESTPKDRISDMPEDEFYDNVKRFAKEPLAVVQGALEGLVPGGKDDPTKYKKTEGRIILVGPSAHLNGSDGSPGLRERAMAWRSPQGAMMPSLALELEKLGSNIKARAVNGGTAMQQAEAVMSLFGSVDEPKDTLVYLLR